jgi:hypothetical protein
MRTTLVLLFASLLLLTQDIPAEDPICSLEFREDTRIIGPRTDEIICPATSMRRHDDGTFENAFCWRFMGAVPPDYGSWAECYDSDMVCGIRFFFTQMYYNGQSMDVYVWDSAPGGAPPPGPDPGNVVCVIPGVYPGPIAEWPDISIHDVQVCCETGGPHFVGFWGDWLGGMLCGWYVAVDHDGYYGFGDPCPRTKIAPDIGYEPGWHHPDIVPIMSDIKALGIREFAGPGDCETSSVSDPDGDGPDSGSEITWGRIKALY